MTSLDVERRLTEVLHRHAEDAMSRTDTQHELRRLHSRDDHEPPRPSGRRRTAVVGAGLAVAAVAAAVVWGADLTADRAEPAPPAPAQQTITEQDAVAAAEGFVTAYAAHDAERAAEYVAPDTAPWTGWRRHLARDRAWNSEYRVEPCRAVSSTATGTDVVCIFSLHTMSSEQIGRGPFENAKFEVSVDENGDVAAADVSYNHELNGLMQHLEAVYRWIESNHPEDVALLDLDELDVPQADWDRWLAVWEQRIQDYVEARSKG